MMPLQMKMLWQTKGNSPREEGLLTTVSPSRLTLAKDIMLTECVSSADL